MYRCDMFGKGSRWQPKKLLKNALVVVLSFVVILLIMSILSSGSGEKPTHKTTVSYSALLTQINDKKIGKITYDPNTLVANVDPKDEKKPEFSVVIPGNQSGLTSLLNAAAKNDVSVYSKPLTNDSPGFFSRVIGLIPSIILLAIILLVFRQYSPARGGKAGAVHSTTTFADVAGCDEAIEELIDVRNYLKNPGKYEAIGARVPKGVLLYGPPGTGKTLLAKAVANEAGVSFFETSGSEFVELFAGLGAKKVRDIFKRAKKEAPSIIFIDEMDAIGKKRSSGNSGDGGGREADQTLNELLKQMDGFDTSKHPVIIMGATNRIEELDPALLRANRLDRHIEIAPPDKHGRLEILQIHAKGKKISSGVNLDRMALQSSGMSGAELELWLNESAMIAARYDHSEITNADVEEALMRIVAGAKKRHRMMTDEEREKVAYHEAGHAVIGEILDTANKVHKISIIPRGQSGGQTISVSDRDTYLYSKQALLDQIAMLMGGRAAENIKFKELSSGAHDDLKRASHIAVRMITQLGMGESIGMLVTSDEVKLSTALNDKVDKEAQKLLSEQLTAATDLLNEHWEKVESVANVLLAEETIDRDRFLEVIGHEPEPIDPKFSLSKQ